MKTKNLLLKSIICISLFLILISCTNKRGNSGSQSDIPADTIPVYPDTLKLVFVGDVMGHLTQLNGARNDGGDTTYNFFPPYQFIQPYIASADLALANLEVAFGGTPYSGYPRFSSPPQIADALKECGFDVLFTANNHAVDMGKKGLENTLSYIDNLGFKYTGTFRDSTERANNYPLIIEANNIRLALLNYTYDTNGMPVYYPNIVNEIDTVLMKKDLEKAISLNPDYVITCIHWGIEYKTKENSTQRSLARFLSDNGTDIIIGSHPHVVQPYDEIVTESGKVVPVIYSLGNFISNQRDRYCDGGIAFELNLTKSDNQVSVQSTSYEPLWVNRFYVNGKVFYRMIPVNDYHATPEKYELTDAQRDSMLLFYDDTNKILPNLPYSNYYQD